MDQEHSSETQPPDLSSLKLVYIGVRRQQRERPGYRMRQAVYALDSVVMSVWISTLPLPYTGQAGRPAL